MSSERSWARRQQENGDSKGQSTAKDSRQQGNGDSKGTATAREWRESSREGEWAQGIPGNRQPIVGNVNRRRASLPEVIPATRCHGGKQTTCTFDRTRDWDAWNGIFSLSSICAHALKFYLRPCHSALLKAPRLLNSAPSLLFVVETTVLTLNLPSPFHISQAGYLEQPSVLALYS